MTEARTANLDRWDERFRDDPYPEYAKLRAEGRAHRFADADGGDSWILGRYEDVREALADRRLSKALDDARLFRRLSQALVDRGVADSLEAAGEELRRAGIAGAGNTVTRTVFDTDPPEHTRLRRLVARAFTPRRIEERLRPRVQAMTDELLDRMEGRPVVDLVPALAVPLPVSVICELLGVPAGDRDRFLGWFMPDAIAATGAPEWEDAATRYLTDLVARRRPSVVADLPEDEQPDLVSVLIAARDEGGALTEQQLVLTLTLLLRAGHETMVQLIAIGMLALLENPDQLRLLRERPDLDAAAVEELLRFTSPIQQSSPRFAIDDVPVGDVTVRDGDRVRMGIASANRDSRRFADPDRLDIARADNHHVALGHGPHFCLGAPLARQEGQIVFRTLLRRFPDIALAADPADLPWRPYGTLRRGLASLPVRLRAGEAV